MSRVCVFFGTGYEEIEALTVVDILRREKIQTDMVSVTGKQTVIGSHGISVEMDMQLEEVDFSQVDMIVLPGGAAGVEVLENCHMLMQQVDTFLQSGKPVAAICAAPSILGHKGYLKGKKAVVYPTFESHLAGAEVMKAPAIQDGNIITGRGMGCSIPFALKLVEYFKGKEECRKLAEKIVFFDEEAKL